MNTLIEDGAGSGQTAAVISNELQVTTESEALKANLRGDAYVALASNVDPGGAGEDWFYMMNNDSRNLVIYKIEGWAVATDDEWTIEIGATDAGTAAGDAITPVNMNAGSGKTADVYIASDETNLAVTGGVTVSLLKTHHTTLLFDTYDFPSGIILPPGTRMHMAAKDGAIVDMHLYFYMCD